MISKNNNGESETKNNVIAAVIMFEWYYLFVGPLA